MADIFKNIPSSSTADAAAVAALEASQAAQDALIAAAPTQAQVDALQAVQNAEDPYSAFARQPDGSINWTRESGAAGTIAVAAADPLSHDGAVQDAAIALRELLANKATSIRANGAADDTSYPSEKAVRDALEALNFAGVYKGSGAASADIPAGANGDWGIATTTNPGIYVTDGTAYTLAKSIPDFLVIANPTAAPGDADYSEVGISGPTQWDQWGQSRRVQRIFDTTGPFDYTNKGYADRTAVYVRNADNSNGIGYTYRTDNTVSLELRRADGTLETDVDGQNSFNVQPAEIVFGEKDGNVFRASIIPGERVKHFLTDALAFAYGPMPHDAIVTIRGTGSMGFRKTGANSAVWPADGISNADWWIIQQDDHQHTTLEKIIVGVSSAGTNALSAVDFVINDKDGNPYPNSDWRVTSQWLQTSGTADNVAYTDEPLPTSLTVGRNKNGVVELVYVGQSPNGTASITATASNGAATGDVKFKFEDTNDTTDFATVGDVGLVDWTIDVAAVPQAVLPDWQAGQAYTVSETKVVGVAPANVEPQIEGKAYILRPKADLTSAAALDFTEWQNYDVVGEYRLSGNTFRVAADGTTESMLFFGIESGTEGNVRVVKKDETATFRWSGVADASFVLEDNSVGQAVHTGGTSQDVVVTGPAHLIHTQVGGVHTLTVFGTIIPVQRREQTYFAHTMPDPTNGIHQIDGSDIDDADFAAWITDNPITGFSVAGTVVSCPDWRGRYLGGSGGLGIGTTAGQTLASTNKSHRHRSGQPAWNTAGAFFGTTSGGSGKGISNWDSYSGSQTPLTDYEGSTYARPETVGLPLCVVIGATRQYVPKEDVTEVEDAEVTLIDVDATNNTLYPFSTGETWAQVKANYTHLRITGNASVSGSNNVKPYSFDFDPNTHTLPQAMSGARIDIDSGHNGVTAYLNFPNDADTGLTYRQSGGDVPTGGRMQFKVVGVKARKTIAGISVSNADTVAAGTYQIRKNPDGTLELV